MKILLGCSAGMSTSLLMKKLEQYWADRGEDHTINAVGLGEISDVYQDYDIVLIGPQVSYRLDEVKEETNLPVAAIPPTDYAMHNCANIMQLAEKLYAQKNVE